MHRENKHQGQRRDNDKHKKPRLGKSPAPAVFVNRSAGNHVVSLGKHCFNVAPVNKAYTDKRAVVHHNVKEHVIAAEVGHIKKIVQNRKVSRA